MLPRDAKSSARPSFVTRHHVAFAGGDTRPLHYTESMPQCPRPGLNTLRGGAIPWKTNDELQLPQSVGLPRRGKFGQTGYLLQGGIGNAIFGLYATDVRFAD